MAVLASVRCPDGKLLIGDAFPVRIMALLGSTSKQDENRAGEKVSIITQNKVRPDVVADLSVRRTKLPLWRRILSAGLPAATLPIYTANVSQDRIDKHDLLDRATEQLEGGVGLITIHPTATRSLVDTSRRRKIPWTSRGGGMVIRDMLARNSHENVYMTILPDLASLARRSGATISIGATFRSATILDAGDQAQLSEMKIQASIAEELRREGCSVIVEGPGHATPVAIKSLAEAMLQAKCPIMPLGPIPTDRAIGQDHISSAIGATLLGIAGAAHILAAVTREEHTGGVPNIASTIEAIEAARIAAQVIDIHRFGPSALDEYVANSRSTQRTCVFGKETKGCSRCGKTCPL